MKHAWFRIRLLVVAVGVMCSCPFPARAEMPLNQFNVAVGVASSVHDDGVHLKDSFATEAGYYRRLQPWFALGLEAGLFVGAKVGGVVPTAVDADGDGQADNVHFDESAFGATFRLTPVIQVGPILKGGGIKWNPYVSVGGGSYWVVLARTRGLPDSVPTRSMHGGFNYGAGLTLFFPGNWGIGAEFRCHQIIDRQNADAVYRTPTVHLSWLY